MTTMRERTEVFNEKYDKKYYPQAYTNLLLKYGFKRK